MQNVKRLNGFPIVSIALPNLLLMSDLDHRLDALLEKRKLQGRYRSVKEYSSASTPNLVDFVSRIQHHSSAIVQLISSHQMTTYPLLPLPRSDKPTSLGLSLPPIFSAQQVPDFSAGVHQPTELSKPAFPTSSFPPRPFCSIRAGMPTYPSSAQYLSRTTG